MTHIEQSQILLDSTDVVTVHNVNAISVLRNGVNYLLEHPHIKFEYFVGDKSVTIYYVKKYKKRNKIDAVLNTWTKKLKDISHLKYSYTVEIFYKHFPILVKLDTSDLKNQKISVQNFYGCKDNFVLNFKSLTAPVKYDNKKNLLYFESNDDITLGNELELFNKLRYKTHIKNVDRTIFTDGFFIKKSLCKV